MRPGARQELSRQTFPPAASRDGILNQGIYKSDILFIGHLELELHSFEGGGWLDGPLAPALRDVQARGGGGGRLPQQEVHLQSLTRELMGKYQASL